MKIKALPLTVAIMGCLATPAMVSAAQGEFMAGVGVSVTQGVGVTVGYDITDHLTLRGSYYEFSYDDEDNIDDIDFDIDLSLENVGAFIDYHPWATDDNGFRITAGILNNGNELNATGRPTGGSYTIGGTTYSAAQVGTLKADVEFDSTAPYLGIGYDFAPTEHLRVTTDLGVIFQGSPDVSYAATGVLASNPVFQQDLRREEQEAEDDLDSFEYLPVLKLALTYRF